MNRSQLFGVEHAGVSMPDKSRYRTSAVLELHFSGKRVNQELNSARLELFKSRYTHLGGNAVFIVTVLLFLVPGTLLTAAWRRYFQEGVVTQIP
jgi:hypothetical protein